MTDMWPDPCPHDSFGSDGTCSYCGQPPRPDVTVARTNRPDYAQAVEDAHAAHQAATVPGDLIDMACDAIDVAHDKVWHRHASECCIEYSRYSEAVLQAVLPVLADRIEALEPDELGRISKGLALAIVLGEAS